MSAVAKVSRWTAEEEEEEDEVMWMEISQAEVHGTVAAQRLEPG